MGVGGCIRVGARVGLEVGLGASVGEGFGLAQPTIMTAPRTTVSARMAPTSKLRAGFEPPIDGLAHAPVAAQDVRAVRAQVVGLALHDRRVPGQIDAIQVIYNIFDQAPEDDLFPACRENGVAVIARVPFDEGSLTGTLTRESHWPADDWRSTYFVPENLESSVAHADALKPLVPAGMTMPEMALRFILSNPDVTTVIPGMRKARHVETNVAAAEAGPLPAPLLTELRRHRWDRQPTEWSQ